MIKSVYKKIRNLDWKKHLVDTTAINTLAVPICAAMETSAKICSLMSKIPYIDVNPIPSDVSLKTRIYGAGGGYLGLAFLFSKGRDASRRLFNIKETSKEYLQLVHDAAYTIAFNAVVNPILYYSSGSRDPKEIIGGTLALSVFSLFAGGPIGYIVDVFRDLTGLKSCKRKLYPNFIKNQNPRVKKGLAALLVTGSMIATAGIYALTTHRGDYHSPEINSPQSISRPYESHTPDITSFINR